MFNLKICPDFCQAEIWSWASPVLDANRANFNQFNYSYFHANCFAEFFNPINGG